MITVNSTHAPSSQARDNKKATNRNQLFFLNSGGPTWTWTRDQKIMSSLKK